MRLKNFLIFIVIILVIAFLPPSRPYVNKIIIWGEQKLGGFKIQRHINNMNSEIDNPVLSDKDYIFEDIESISLVELENIIDDGISCRSYTIKDNHIVKAFGCNSKENNYLYDYSKELGFSYIGDINKENIESNEVIENTEEETEVITEKEEVVTKKEEAKPKENKVESITVPKYTVDSVRSSDPKYNGGFVMPDIYNTGYISKFSDLKDLKEKYPELSGCRITSAIAKKYNYVFEGFKTNCELLINGVDNVTIRDFYIENNSWYGIKLVAYNGLKTPENITITDGEIKGTKAAGILGSNVTIKRVYIHDYNADAIKLSSNQIIESNYIGSGGMGDGAHADGVQLTGTCVNTIIRGNRFDMIAIPNGNYKANATIFLKLESGYSDGVVVSNNWLNGGGYTTYIVRKDSVDGKFTNLTYSNNKIGNGYRFGTLSWNKSIPVNGMGTQVYMDDIKVPSIGSILYYDKNNRIVSNLNNISSYIKVLVNGANYTSEDLKIKVSLVIYDKNGNAIKLYSKENTIPKNISAKKALNDTSLTVSSFPFNVPTYIEVSDLPSIPSGGYIKTIVSIDNYEIRSDIIYKK